MEGFARACPAGAPQGARRGGCMYSQVLAGAAAVPAVHQSAWLQVRHLIPIGVVGLISWSVWLSRFTLSRLYRPTPPGYTCTTSVVVPSFREDPAILDRCLNSWLAERPTEVIVVPDLADVDVIMLLRERAATEARLHVVPFAHQGKRSALGGGHPPRQSRGPGAGRLRHRVGAGAACRGSGSVRKPPGRRRWYPAERVPAADQCVAR